MKNFQKGFVIPLLLAVIALLLAGGTYVYLQQKQTNQPVIENSAAQTTPTTKQSTSPTAPTKTSITILSPNGGESFAAGQNVPISLDADGLDPSRQYRAEVTMVIPNAERGDSTSGFYLAKPCYTPATSINRCNNVTVSNGASNMTLTIPSIISRTSGDYNLIIKVVDWTSYTSGIGEEITVVATATSVGLISISATN